MKRTRKVIATTLLPFCLWLAFMGWLASGYGTRWEFGRYWMPRTLLAADGIHFPDGTEAPVFSRVLRRMDIEEELEALAFTALLLAFGKLAWELDKLHRLEQELVRELRNLARLQEQVDYSQMDSELLRLLKLVPVTPGHLLPELQRRITARQDFLDEQLQKSKGPTG